MSEFTLMHPNTGAMLHFDDYDSAARRALGLANYWGCCVVVMENNFPVACISPMKRDSIGEYVDVDGEI